MTLAFAELGLAAMLASFALAHLSLSVAASVVLARVRDTRAPAARARLVFLLGTLPTLGASVTAALVGLAYLRHEPFHGSETAGLPLLLLAAAGSLLLARSLATIASAWWRTRRFVRSWLSASTPAQVAGTRAEVGVHSHPLVSVVGVLRPRLFLERRVLSLLTNEELALVISHEKAHLHAGDNLRQLLLAACADWPGVPCATRAHAYLSCASELAADAAAAATPAAACTLAGAIVKLARLVPSEPVPDPLASAFLRQGTVAQRVAALLATDRGEIGGEEAGLSMIAAMWLSLVATGLAALPSLHAATELLVRLGR